MPVTINGTTGIAGVDGSAGTPAVQGSDTNTGVYFPAADTLSASTGGTERMRIDASGNVGVGTTGGSAGSYKLEVNGDIGLTWGVSADRFLGSKYFTSYELGLHLLEATRETRIVSKAADSTGLISFYTGVTPTERMRVDASGNVGIGTSSPSALFDVRNSASTVAKIKTTGLGSFGALQISNSNTNGEASIGFRDDSDADAASWVIGKSVGATDAFGFYYNGTKMLIDTSGNVGIGTSPSAKLHVGEGDAIIGRTTGIAQLSTNSGSVGAFLHANSGGVGSVGTASNHALWLLTNNTQRATLGTDGTFVLTSSGGLGYGTGSGGTVTQATSKGTAVTLNKTNGKITMSNSSLSPGPAGFTVTNSTVAATDTIIINIAGGVADASLYNVWAIPTAGGFVVYLRNISSGALAEAVQLNFSVIKATTS